MFDHADEEKRIIAQYRLKHPGDKSVTYVQQGQCVVSEDDLITTNLKVCCGLGIKFGSINALTHIHSSTTPNIIVTPIKKQNIPVDTPVSIKVWLGDTPAIHSCIVPTLMKLNILHHWLNLEDLKKMTEKLVLQRTLSLTHRSQLKEDSSPEDEETIMPHAIYRFNKLLALNEIKTDEDASLVTFVLNYLEDESKLRSILGDKIAFMQQNDIVSTEEIKHATPKSQHIKEI